MQIFFNILLVVVGFGSKKSLFSEGLHNMVSKAASIRSMHTSAWMNSPLSPISASFVKESWPVLRVARSRGFSGRLANWGWLPRNGLSKIDRKSLSGMFITYKPNEQYE